MSVPNPATTDWVPIFAGGNPLAYRADWASGTTYVDGDIVVKDGVAYLCAGGPTSVAPDITPWGGAVANRPPGELAFAQITANVSITATSEAAGDVVITAPAVVCDGVTPVIVEFFAPALAPAGTGSYAALALWDGGSVIGASWINAQGPVAGSVLARLRLTPSAGSHTFSVRGMTYNGTSSVYAGSGTPGAYSPAYISVIRANPVFLAPAGPTVPTYGLALPSSPADGQEHVLVDSLTNPSYQWRFRYNAGSSSAYKWEFVGGPPLSAEVATNGATLSTTYTDLSSPGPSIALPRAGDYIVTHGCTAWAASRVAYMSYAIGATAAVDADCVYARIDTAVNIMFAGSRTRRKDGLGAVTLTAKYRSSNSDTNGTFENRWLMATPVRVA